MEITISENMELLEMGKTPFIESGDCSDEIVLKFDNSNELYVSQNFLSYASPVFKAMFQTGFKEIEERTVNLKGKDYDDVLELLMCIHPAILKPVDRSNVLRLLALTDEYHITVIKEKCEQVLNVWLEEIKNSAQSSPNVSSTKHYQRAEVCLKILAVAVSVNHEDLMKSAIDVLSLCRFKAITGLHFTTSYEKSDDDPVKHRESCAKIFGDLPDEMKVKVLTARLQKCDNC